MLAKIKEEFKTATVAFGGSGFPLGKREDIDDLAIIALESQNKRLLRLFETLPKLEVLKKAKTDKALKQITDGIVEENTTEPIREDSDDSENAIGEE